MNDLDARLSKCFASVFPKLPEGLIPKAEVDSVEGWDSIASAMLLSVVSDEFSLTLNVDDVEQLTSYAGIRAWVLNRTEHSN
jgi:acyl carrier protein